MINITNRGRFSSFCIFILLIVFLSNPVSRISSFQNYSINEGDGSSFSSLTPHDAINIYSNSDFISLGFPGTGVIGDPYRIENLLIENLNSYGMFIAGVSVYCVIQNCVIRNVTYSGMKLVSIHDGFVTVKNNTVYTANSRGIHVTNSVNVTIDGNNCTSNYIGIDVEYSPNCTILRNTCDRNEYLGVRLNINSYNCSILDNSVSDNNILGIYSVRCKGGNIINNSLSNNGLWIYDNEVSSYSRYVVKLNTINGLKLGYFYNNHSLNFTTPEYGQIVIYNSENITIENQVFQNTIKGMYVFNCSNLLIQNNLFTSNLDGGLDIILSDNCTVLGNTFSDMELGLYFEVCQDVVIGENIFLTCGLFAVEGSLTNYANYYFYNNTVNGLKLGVFFDERDVTLSASEYGQIFLINCTNFKIQNQIITYTTYGILLYSCTDCEISNSEIENNVIGIAIFECRNLLIENNLIRFNEIGLDADSSTELDIVNNNLSSNEFQGIDLTNTTFSEVRNCNASFNIQGLSMYLVSDINVESNLFDHNRDFGSIMLYAHYILFSENTYTSNFFGLFARYSFVNTIENNYFRYNENSAIYLVDSGNFDIFTNNASFNMYGVRFYSTSSCKIAYNTFERNEKFGVSLDFRSEDSVIHHNYFIDNNYGGSSSSISQALDDGFNNTWFDVNTFEGNWWSEEVDNYRIAGISGSTDPFPLNAPFENVTVPPPTEENNFSSFSIILISLGFMSFLCLIIQRKKLKIIKYEK